MPRRRQAIGPKPHDFIHLDIFNSVPFSTKVAGFYQKGLSLRDVAGRVGLSKSKVRDILLEQKLPLRERTGKEGRAVQTAVGKRNAKPSYGFSYFDGKVVRHPDEYPVLLKIIDRWERGQPLNSIAVDLNEKRIPSPNQKMWSWNSISNIIKRIQGGYLVQVGNHYELR